MNLSNKRIQQLLKSETKGQKLSVYIPTHPNSNSQNISQDVIRFKNALQRIKNDSTYDDKVLGESYKKLEELLNDTEFWKYQDHGLAVFADKNGYTVFHLPYEITEACFINNSYFISPLVVMQSINSGFYVVEINLKTPRMFYGRGGELRQIAQELMPGAFADTVARDEYTQELQHQGFSTRNGASFHGHDPDEEIDEDKLKYLRLIAHAVNTHLKENHEQPLLLAGTANRVGNIRQFIKYPHVIDETLTGNYEQSSAQELYNHTQPIINNYLHERREKLIEQVLAAPPELVVRGKHEIEAAAETGRIERLYVTTFRNTADSVQNGTAEVAVLQLPDDMSDLEKMIRQTLAQAGEVQATEISENMAENEPKALCRF